MLLKVDFNTCVDVRASYLGQQAVENYLMNSVFYKFGSFFEYKYMQINEFNKITNIQSSVKNFLSRLILW